MLVAITPRAFVTESRTGEDRRINLVAIDRVNLIKYDSYIRYGGANEISPDLAIGNNFEGCLEMRTFQRLCRLPRNEINAGYRKIF
jgi:hypothetical protein